MPRGYVLTEQFDEDALRNSSSICRIASIARLGSARAP
jgi:hypothetical protein